MIDFEIVFTLLTLALVGFAGFVESRMLHLIQSDLKGSTLDNQRKFGLVVMFLIPTVGYYFIVSQAMQLEIVALKLFSCVVWAGSLRWLIRDGVQNYFSPKRKPFFYTGTVAAIDRFFGSENQTTNAIKKLGFAVIGGVLFWGFDWVINLI